MEPRSSAVGIRSGVSEGCGFEPGALLKRCTPPSERLLMSGSVGGVLVLS